MPVLALLTAQNWLDRLALLTAQNWLDRLAQAIAGLIDAIGGPGIALAVFLEQLFPPIPSELILPFAGFTAAQPGARFGVIAAILWATLGSVGGAWALYWIGRALGRDRTVRVISRLPLTSRADVERTIAWFDRHGKRAVFFGRMLPLFRSFISIPAGIARMPQALFLGLTAAGSLLWNSVFVTAGFLLGDHWRSVLRYGEVLERAVIVGVAALIVWWIARRLRRRPPRSDPPRAPGV